MRIKVWFFDSNC